MTLPLPSRTRPVPVHRAVYRSQLPQLGDRLFLADGGIETTLIYGYRLDLPHFAAFHLFADAVGRAALRDYFRTYAEIARRQRVGLVLETATWRTSSDWGNKLGYGADDLARIQHESVVLLEEIREAFETPQTPIVISGCVGPRGDGYNPSFQMSAETARRYHAPQIAAFAESSADLVSAITMNYVDEAIGVVRAAQDHAVPSVIAFTVETDGRLPTGESLRDAIERVDHETGEGPEYFMVNCAHPDHFEHVMIGDDAWLSRIRGVRANASTLSHAELDRATELHDGDPEDLGERYASLRRRLTDLTVMGGCCGTDHRHIERIGEACASLF